MSSAALSGLFFDPLATSGAVVPAAATVAAPAAPQHRPDRTAPRREPEKPRHTENRAAALQEVCRDLERLSRRRGRS